MTEKSDDETAVPQDVPLTKTEIGVALRRMFLASEDEKVRLRCLELALEVADVAPTASVDPLRKAMQKIREG